MRGKVIVTIADREHTKREDAFGADVLIVTGYEEAVSGILDSWMRLAASGFSA